MFLSVREARAGLRCCAARKLVRRSQLLPSVKCCPALYLSLVLQSACSPFVSWPPMFPTARSAFRLTTLFRPGQIPRSRFLRPTFFFCARRVFLPRSVCLSSVVYFQFFLSANDFGSLDCLRHKRTTRSTASVYSVAARSSSAAHKQLSFLLCPDSILLELCCDSG
jgi:hypothetical protein